MALIDLVVPIIAVVALLIVVRLCLPNLLIVIGYSRLQCGFRGGPEEVECYWLNDVDEQLYQEMTSLGFRPLGVYWEQMPLTRVFVEYIFVRPGGDCYGIVQPNDQTAPRRAHFLTVFADGAVAQTQNYAGGVEMDKPDFVAGPPDAARTIPSAEAPAPSQASTKHFKYLFCLSVLLTVVAAGADSTRWAMVVFGIVSIFAGSAAVRSGGTAGVKTATQDTSARVPLAEVRQLHGERVGRFISQGHPLPPAFDTEGFLEAERRYYDHPSLRWLLRLVMLGLLVAQLFALGIIPFGLGCYFGIAHVAPWAALLGAGLVGLWLRYGCSSATVLRLLGTPPPATCISEPDGTAPRASSQGDADE